MTPYMVGKLAPKSSYLTRGLVKYVLVRGHFRAVPSQNGDKYVTSPPPPIVELVRSVALVESDNHPFAITWRGEANGAVILASALQHRPYRNLAVGTSHTITNSERYGFERSGPTNRRSPAATEVGGVRVAGRGTQTSL